MEKPYTDEQIAELVKRVLEDVYTAANPALGDVMRMSQRGDFGGALGQLEDALLTLEKTRVTLRTARDMQESNERVMLANMGD